MTQRVIVFVDDEPNILDALKTRLHRLRRVWAMHFVPSGQAALELLSRLKVDVLVTDMRMPEMDGAELLATVKAAYPNIIRIVLSGHSELETAMRAIPIAHQFLSKPCEPGALEKVVERAVTLQSLISEDVVRRAIGRIDRLPPVPHLYAKLTQALEADVSIAEVALILEDDPAMCARLLQVVNSSFFRMSRRITRVQEAVAYLGLDTVKQLVLSVELFSLATPPTIISLDELAAHSSLVARLAASFMTEPKQRDEAFVAGLLHDLGKLVLATVLRDDYAQILTEARRTGASVLSVEAEVLGVTHAELGGYLLGLWGLPMTVVEAVVNHHAPRRLESTSFGVLAATHVANALAAELTPGGEGELDGVLVAELGLEPRLAEYRALALELRDSVAEP